MGRSIPKDNPGEPKTNKIKINTIIVPLTNRSKNQEYTISYRKMLKFTRNQSDQE